MKKLIISLLICVAAIAAITELNAQTVQCPSTTSKGLQCKNTADSTGFCWFHNPNVSRCGHSKNDGTPCRNIVQHPGETCYLHNEKYFRAKFNKCSDQHVNDICFCVEKYGLPEDMDSTLCGTKGGRK